MRNRMPRILLVADHLTDLFAMNVMVRQLNLPLNEMERMRLQLAIARGDKAIEQMRENLANIENEGRQYFSNAAELFAIERHDAEMTVFDIMKEVFVMVKFVVRENH